MTRATPPGHDIDFEAPLTAMAAAKPDLVYFGAYYNDAALLMRQARQMGMTQTISGSGVDYADALITLGGNAVEGAYLCTLFFPNSSDPRDKAFIKAFTQKYGKAPTVNASESYEGAKIMFEAIRIGGTDRAKVRAALENMKDFVAFNSRYLSARRTTTRSTRTISSCRSRTGSSLLFLSSYLE